MPSTVMRGMTMGIIEVRQPGRPVVCPPSTSPFPSWWSSACHDSDGAGRALKDFES